MFITISEMHQKMMTGGFGMSWFPFHKQKLGILSDNYDVLQIACLAGYMGNTKYVPPNKIPVIQDSLSREPIKSLRVCPLKKGPKYTVVTFDEILVG